MGVEGRRARPREEIVPLPAAANPADHGGTRVEEVGFGLGVEELHRGRAGGHGVAVAAAGRGRLDGPAAGRRRQEAAGHEEGRGPGVDGDRDGDGVRNAHRPPWSTSFAPGWSGAGDPPSLLTSSTIGWVQSVEPFWVLADPGPAGVPETIFGMAWLRDDETNAWRVWLWRSWLALAW